MKVHNVFDILFAALLIIILVVFVLSISGCGGGEEPLDKSTIEPVKCSSGNTTGVCT